MIIFNFWFVTVGKLLKINNYYLNTHTVKIKIEQDLSTAFISNFHHGCAIIIGPDKDGWIWD